MSDKYSFTVTSGSDPTRRWMRSWLSHPPVCRHWRGGNGNSLTTAFTDTTQIVQITITAVPEPSTYAGIAGLAALVMVSFYKRRKRSWILPQIR